MQKIFPQMITIPLSTHMPKIIIKLPVSLNNKIKFFLNLKVQYLDYKVNLNKFFDSFHRFPHLRFQLLNHYHPSKHAY